MPLPLLGVEKNCTHSKQVHSSCVKLWQKPDFSKTVLWGNFFGALLDARNMHLFEISAKRFFFIPFADNVALKFFLVLIRSSCIFLEDKRSNKVETIQHFRKNFSHKLVYGMQWEPKVT